MRINPDQVRKDNEERAKKGIVTVKSGLIINTGENPTKESRKEIYEENKKKYELTLEEVENLVLDDDLFVIKRKKRIKFTNFVENYVKENKEKIEIENEKKEDENENEIENLTEKEMNEMIKKSKSKIKNLENLFY